MHCHNHNESGKISWLHSNSQQLQACRHAPDAPLKPVLPDSSPSPRAQPAGTVMANLCDQEGQRRGSCERKPIPLMHVRHMTPKEMRPGSPRSVRHREVNITEVRRAWRRKWLSCGFTQPPVHHPCTQGQCVPVGCILVQGGGLVGMCRQGSQKGRLPQGQGRSCAQQHGAPVRAGKAHTHRVEEVLREAAWASGTPLATQAWQEPSPHLGVTCACLSDADVCTRHVLPRSTAGLDANAPARADGHKHTWVVLPGSLQVLRSLGTGPWVKRAAALYPLRVCASRRLHPSSARAAWESHTTPTWPLA